MSGYIIGFIVDFLQLLLFFIGIYYMGISVFSLVPCKYKKSYEGYKRFAIVIPAHNEAAVIGKLLISLKEQEYPKEYYNIYVMADFCTDSTVQISRKMGANVLLPSKRSLKGKGAALSDAFNQINDLDVNFDAFVVLDADNIADFRFLAEINLCMQQGNSIVQGYVDASNPNSSWVSHAYAIWYWITNRISQTGFCRLGLGCRINGTGFALSKEVLDIVPWNTISLTEDIEYTAKLAVKNLKVVYANKAIVFDEKPEHFLASVKQRCRWAQGNVVVQKKYIYPLIRAGKWNSLFSLWSDFLMPLCFVLLLLIDFFAILDLSELATLRFVSFWLNPINMIILNLYLFGSIFTVCCGLVLDKKLNCKIILNFLGFVVYLISWIPIGFFGILHHTKNDWYHTVHKNNE